MKATLQDIKVIFKNCARLKVILFGFIFTFFSSFGQSFFLGLFNNSIRNELSITHGQFGSIYASATLLSSFCFNLGWKKN